MKKINVEILTNLHVSRSQQESEEVVFKNVVCTLYSATVAGDKSTSGILMKLWIWEGRRLGHRCAVFRGCLIRGTMEGSSLGDTCRSFEIRSNDFDKTR